MERSIDETLKRGRNQISSQREWRCYPTKRQYPYQVGEKVLVKSKDTNVRYVLGSIQSLDDSKSGGVTIKPENSRKTEKTEIALIQLKDCRRLMPWFRYPELSTVIITSETTPFRQLASQVFDTDRVLEIGCSSGETSRILLSRARSWVGFDTSDEMLKLCERYLPPTPGLDGSSSSSPSTKAVKIDALVDPTKAKEEANTFGSPNVIFIDIGGNREVLGVLRMLSWAFEHFDEAQLIVVKSREAYHSIHSSCKVEKLTGVFDGQTWFESRRAKRAKPKHPLKAPMVLSPKDNKTPICRYYNYHEKGCQHSPCEFDHEHCHACLKPGHVARNCPIFE